MRFLLAAILFFPLLLNAQTPVVPVFRALLPDTLSESSGIEYVNDTSIWSHNDSGHPGFLCQLDTAGQLRRILHLAGVTVNDPEELAQDSAGWFYIGDFGNNANNRTDLRIYKIPPPHTISSDSITPQVISFSFADQDSFPPSASGMNFDCEAMFHFNHALYLFSKNRGTSTYTRMYVIPDTAGTYNVMPTDSFDSQQWITSADISPDGQRMVLFSEWNIYVFSNFTGDDFFQGNVLHLTITPYSQKEAVVFANDSLLYLTDEILFSTGGKLYSLDLNSIGTAIPDYTRNPLTKLIPNPAADFVTVSTAFAGFQWTVLSADGRVIHTGFASGSSAEIDCRFFAPGLYFIRITSENEKTEILPLLKTQ